MITMDKFTEEISHFIGFFHISVENARAREAYSEFAFTKVELEVEKLSVHTSDFGAPFDLLGFDPGFGYRSPAPDHWHVPIRLGDAPPIPAGRTVGYAMEGRPLPDTLRDALATPMKTVQSFSAEIDPPGSIVNHFSQAISLSDDDYFGVGGHGLAFNAEAVDDATVLEGFEEASALSPLGDFARAGSSEDLIGLIKTIIEQLEDVPGDSDAVQLHISTATIDGTYVNGELVEEVPLIEDYHSIGSDESAEEENAEAGGSNAWVSGSSR